MFISEIANSNFGSCQASNRIVKYSHYQQFRLKWLIGIDYNRFLIHSIYIISNNYCVKKALMVKMT